MKLVLPPFYILFFQRSPIGLKKGDGVVDFLWLWMNYTKDNYFLKKYLWLNKNLSKLKRNYHFFAGSGCMGYWWLIKATTMEKSYQPYHYKFRKLFYHLWWSGFYRGIPEHIGYRYWNKRRCADSIKSNMEIKFMSLKKVYEYFRVVTCMGNELIEIDC